jgi:hypothetical protein
MANATHPIRSYWDAVEPYYKSINIYGNPAEFATSTAEIPRYVVLLYAAHMCQSEVFNGGFLQLFWNSTGILVPEAIESFKHIGMPELASLVNEAAALVGNPYPREREERWDALLAATGRNEMEMEQIFDKYAALGKPESLYQAFAEATKDLPLDALDRRFWETVKTENSGFEDAATRFAQAPFLIQ